MSTFYALRLGDIKGPTQVKNFENRFLISDLTFSTETLEGVSEVSFTISDPGVVSPKIEQAQFSIKKFLNEGFEIKAFSGSSEQTTEIGTLKNSDDAQVFLSRFEVVANDDGIEYRVTLQTNAIVKNNTFDWVAETQLESGSFTLGQELKLPVPGPALNSNPTFNVPNKDLFKDNDVRFGPATDRSTQSDARYFLKYEGGTGTDSYNTYFVEIDSFAFESTRELNEKITPGAVAITRAADDASLMFTHLEETQATGGKFQIHVVREVQNSKIPWITTDVYQFAALPDQKTVQGVVLGGTSDSGGLKEELELNFDLYKHSSVGFENGKSKEGVEVTRSFSDPENNVVDSRIFKVKDLTLDVTGAIIEGGPPIGTGSDNPLQNLKYYLEIEGIKGPVDIGGVKDYFEIGGFYFNPSDNELKIDLPEDLKISKIAGLVLANTRPSELTIVAAGGSGTSDLEFQSKIVISRPELASLETDFDRTSVLSADGGTSRVLTLNLDPEVSTGQEKPTLRWEQIAPGTYTLNAAKGAKDDNLDGGTYGGRNFLPGPGEAPRPADQKIFMRVTQTSAEQGEQDKSTDWVEINGLELSYTSVKSIFDPTLFATIRRNVDEASSKLFQLMIEDRELKIDITIMQEFPFGAQGGPDWRVVRQYELNSAKLLEVGNSGAAVQDFAQENLTLEYTGLREEAFEYSETGDKNSDGHFEILNGILFVRENEDILPSPNDVEGNFDPTTGELSAQTSPTGPLIISPGLALFMKVEEKGASDDVRVDSGDGILRQAFEPFDEWFAVDGYELNGYQFGIEGFSVSVSALQNWIGLDALAADLDEFDVTLVLADLGANSGQPSQEIWKLEADNVTLSQTGSYNGLNRDYTVNFANSGDVTWTVLDSEDGTQENGSKISGTYDLADQSFSGLKFDDPQFNENIGRAWNALLKDGEGLPDTGIERFMIKFTGQDGKEWREAFTISLDLESFTLNAEFESTDESLQHAFWAYVGQDIDFVELETYVGEDQYFGLAEFVLQDVSIDRYEFINGKDFVEMSFANYQSVVASYTGSGDLNPLNVNGNPTKQTDERAYASDGEIDYTLFGATENSAGFFVDSFSGIEQPISLSSSTGNGAARTFSTDFQANATATETEFASVSAAVQAAGSGTTINVNDRSAIGLEDVVVDKSGLTFNIAEGLEANINLEDRNTNTNVGVITFEGAARTNVQGGEQGNEINGGTGNDVINGGAGNDILRGGGGDDLLIDGVPNGSQGVDVLEGGSGNDTIVVNFANGAEIFDGGDDIDTLDISGETAGYTVTLASPFNQFGATFRNFENLIGTGLSDTVTGSDVANIINAGAGLDVVNAGLGDDILTDDDTSTDELYGEGGNDTIRVIGAFLEGTYDGGADLDLLDLSGSERSFDDANTIDLTGATFSAHGATFAGFESVIGSRFDDEIRGGATSGAVLDGGGGNDVITGSSGDVTLLGGAGNDSIKQGEFAAGRDTIDAGSGDDTVSVFFVVVGDVIDGGSDVDTLDVSLETVSFTIDLSGENAEFVQFATFRNFENIIGTNLGDNITGSGEANVINGGGGEDSISTGDGADIIIDDDDAADIINAGIGNDTVRVMALNSGSYDGNEGVDTLDLSMLLTAFSGANKILLGEDFTAGTSAFSSFENVLGGFLGDEIIGNSEANEINGGTGSDMIMAGQGDDTIIDEDADADTIDAGEGADVVVLHNLSGGGSVDGGGGEDDTVDFSNLAALPNVAVALSETITLLNTTLQGFENAIGSDGNDIFTAATSGSTLDGRAGSDTLNGAGGDDTFIDSDEDTDAISGFAGNDLFVISDLSDGHMLDGGEDDDTLDVSAQGFGFSESNRLVLDGTGGAIITGFETIIATNYADFITGSGEHETILGGGGSDSIDGGEGDDIIDGGVGSDTLDGGGGTNTVSYASITNGISLQFQDSGEILALVGEVVNDILSNFQNAIGSQGADFMGGNNAANALSGAGGADQLFGGGGADILSGGLGADVIETGAGADRVEGSGEELDGDRIRDFEAEDAIVVQAMKLDAAAVKVSAGSAIFEIDGDGDGVTDSRFTLDGDFSGQAFEVTSDGTDTTIALAGAGASQLSATGERFITTDGGENRVYGGLGDDVILSAGGADILSGGAGDDTLLGGNDDDILLGGLGNDTMTGGAGRDIFAIDASDFSAGFNSNFITDFTPGEDILELTGFGFNDFSGLSQQNVADGVLIVLGPGLISLNGLSLGDLGADDVSFGDAGRSYGLVSTTVVHRLTEEADRFLTTDPAANEVRAGGGDDVVIGAGGADVIYGEAGGDVLLGGAGADILQGGAGFDTLTGGADADQFVFEAGEETEFGLDVITDFTVGEDVVVATGFGLNATSFDDFTVTSGGLTAQLAHNQIVVFQGITDASELGNLTQVFDFG